MTRGVVIGLNEHKCDKMKFTSGMKHRCYWCNKRDKNLIKKEILVTWSNVQYFWGEAWKFKWIHKKCLEHVRYK